MSEGGCRVDVGVLGKRSVGWTGECFVRKMVCVQHHYCVPTMQRVGRHKCVCAASAHPQHHPPWCSSWPFSQQQGHPAAPHCRQWPTHDRGTPHRCGCHPPPCDPPTHDSEGHRDGGMCRPCSTPDHPRHERAPRFGQGSPRPGVCLCAGFWTGRHNTWATRLCMRALEYTQRAAPHTALYTHTAPHTIGFSCKSGAGRVLAGVWRPAACCCGAPTCGVHGGVMTKVGVWGAFGGQHTIAGAWAARCFVQCVCPQARRWHWWHPHCFAHE